MYVRYSEAERQQKIAEASASFGKIVSTITQPGRNVEQVLAHPAVSGVVTRLRENPLAKNVCLTEAARSGDERVAKAAAHIFFYDPEKMYRRENMERLLLGCIAVEKALGGVGIEFPFSETKGYRLCSALNHEQRRQLQVGEFDPSRPKIGLGAVGSVAQEAAQSHDERRGRKTPAQLFYDWAMAPRTPKTSHVSRPAGVAEIVDDEIQDLLADDAISPAPAPRPQPADDLDLLGGAPLHSPTAHAPTSAPPPAPAFNPVPTQVPPINDDAAARELMAAALESKDHPVAKMLAGQVRAGEKSVDEALTLAKRFRIPDFR